ncbi:MAG: rhodanese-like domain-containing protein [Verrucomicrobia bacterium]|nr:rhodanese-like domain-containing protein [Verrucomicrobiota bacterium]
MTQGLPLFFGASHFPGSLNIGLGSGLFSTWVGFLVPGNAPIALVAGSAEAALEARLDLARIGFDNIAGWIRADALRETQQLSQLSVCDLRAGLQSGYAPLVLDVRTSGEWAAGHIPGASHFPLTKLAGNLAQLPSDTRLAVVCGSGYRSSIAASLLRARRFTRVQNVMGGMAAFQETKCPDWQAADLVYD